MKKSIKSEKSEFVIPHITPHFITNREGKRVGVFIDIEDYETLQQELEDFYLGAVATMVKQKKGSTTSLESIEKKYKQKSKAKRD